MSSESGPTRRKMLQVSTAGAGAVCALALAGCTPSATDESSGGKSALPPPSAGGSPVRVGKLADVPVGSTAAGEANGTKLVVFRPDEKTVLAYSDVCTHAGCQVAPSGEDFKCPCHGSVFKGADGSVVHGPAKDPLPRFAAAIDGEWITVSV